MKESFLATFTRTAFKADFKADDNVPILRTPVVNVFGSTVAQLQNMSKVERAFEYGWYFFAGAVSGLMVPIGLVLLVRPDSFEKLGLIGSILFVLIWLFSLIQFLSLIGYLRFHLKK